MSIVRRINDNKTLLMKWWVVNKIDVILVSAVGGMFSVL